MNMATDGFDRVPAGMGNDSEIESREFVPPILKQYWGAIQRRKFIIMIIVAAALVGGVVVTLMMPRLYTATAQLEINREQKQVTNVEGLDAQNSQDMEFYATQYALLKTRPVVERVVRDLQLASNDEFFAAHGVDIDTLDLGNADGSRTGAESSRNARQDLAVELLLSNVSIDPIRTSRLVNINYTSRVPDISSRIANGWAKAFIAVSMDRQFASTADARKFLEDRLATLRERLEQSERDAVNYAADQGIVSISQERDANGRTTGNRTLAATNLDALNAALNTAIAQRVEAQAALSGSGANSPEALSSNILATLRGQREAAQAQAAQLSVQFEDNYPALRAVREQIASLDTAIARETNRVSQSRREAFQQASQREAALRSQVNALRGQLSTQDRASIQYNIYQRDADTNRQLYDALLQRYKEIGVAGTVGISNIAIVEAAEIPTGPSSPNLIVNLLLAGFAGVLLAGGLTVALEQIDEGIRNPGQVQARLGLPLLGTAPEVDDDVREQLRDSKSELYDAYFSIRSNLAFTTSHGFPRALSVTSTRPAEGKSSTSFALALILARLGKRVVLLDGDMRSPTVHDVVSIPNDRGLSNYLTGDDDWQTLVKPTAQNNLFAIPSGPVPPSAAELLSGDRLSSLLFSLLEQYDHVIVDSPPILGLTDAPIISRAVEGCVLVVEMGGAAVRGIRASIERIHIVGGHIFGVALTKVPHQTEGYGYGYGYGFNYGKKTEDSSNADAAEA
jgi:capsular exopolysaccharide synthesis family protein